MRYACQLWAQFKTVSTRRVLILQKCALRIISFSPPRSPSVLLFKSFEILTIFDLVKTLNISFVHQHLNFQLQTDLCNTIHFNKSTQPELGFTKVSGNEHCMVQSKVTIYPINYSCLLYTSPSPRDLSTSRMPSSA